jgi:hypothetical protein
LRLAVDDLVVPASDGGSPALTAESVSVAPRVFALFGGRLDLGEIDISRPRARLVIADGKVKNLSYRLPKERPSSPIDLDVFADRGPSFEIALQADESRIVRRRTDLTVNHWTTGMEVQDDDLVCRLEARVRVAPDSVEQKGGLRGRG